MNLRLAALLTVVVSAGMLSAPPPALAQEDVFSDIREQGIYYFRRNRFKQARSVLRRARAMPQGGQDALTTIFLAKTHQVLRRLDLAFPLAKRAVGLTTVGTPLGRQARDLLSSLRRSFGEVRLESDVASGPLVLDTSSRFLNPAKRAHYQSTRERLKAADAVFPVSIYLPHGEYRVNGVTFVLDGRRSSAPIVQIPGASLEETRASSTWVLLGSGTLAALAAGATAWFLLSESADRQSTNLSRRVVVDNGEAQE